MEERNINTEWKPINEPVQVERRGLLYYFFRVLFFPFKLLGILLGKGYKVSEDYFKEAVDVYHSNQKTKHLNKILSKRPEDEEVI